MKPLIKFLNDQGIVTYGSCCGHNKYLMSIICYDVPNMTYYELLSNIPIPRKRNFYKGDKKGFYFIPEVENKKINGYNPSKSIFV